MRAVVGVVVVQLQIAMANRTKNNILIITSNQTEDLQPTHPFKLILFKHSFKVAGMSGSTSQTLVDVYHQSINLHSCVIYHHKQLVLFNCQVFETSKCVTHFHISVRVAVGCLRKGPINYVKSLV